ncbi:MAG TPA: dTMP kinase [Miltoncostaeaceae bacterium]|nr:dTMP kinase [Miltoncostaeaceae bacterium]
MSPPRFISFEGIDGCGKSTQAELLARALEAAGARVVRVREPGGTALGEALRGVLLDSAPGTIGPQAEVHLFAAARAQLLEEVIAPALEAGSWVIADRFLDSSLAYQGVARGLGIDAVLAANATVVDDRLPALTVLLRVPMDEATARRSVGDRATDRIEGEGERLQRRVAAAYDQLAERFPTRIVVIDGVGDPQRVHQRVWERVAPLCDGVA